MRRDFIEGKVMLDYSVLMAVFRKDNPGFLELSLNSMCNQTVVPREIVIVKDGPITDELQHVIDRTANVIGIRIVQVQLPINVGLGKALNEGLKYCSCDYVARMDADDYSLSNRCELQLREFELNPELDIVGCPVYEFVDSTENIVGCRDVPYTNEDIYKFAKYRDPFNHPSVIFKRDTVLAVGGYADYRKNQDTELWIRLLLHNARCKNIKEHCLKFRFDSKTFNKRKTWMNTKSLIGIRYNSWRKGFNTFAEFLIVSAGQLFLWMAPVALQKIVYKVVLR